MVLSGFSRSLRPLTCIHRHANLSLLRQLFADAGGAGILTRCPFEFAFRLLLRSRLTPVRLTLTGNPWSFGVRVSRPHYRYLCLHLLFRTLRHPSRNTFGAVRNAPLPSLISKACAASAACLKPVHRPRTVARPVSCYALFERMAASKPTSRLSLRPHFVTST